MQPSGEMPDRFLGVDEARELILSAFSELEHEDIPIPESLGLTIVEDVVAAEDIPPFRNSAMDGYAVRCEDVSSASPQSSVHLRVFGAVAAGHLPAEPLSPGVAMRIMTGAPVPAGANAVIRFEDVTLIGEESTSQAGGKSFIRVDQPVKEWQNVRHPGEDVARGSIVIEHGTRLAPAHVGLLAALNRSHVRVVRRPVVAILATGDEVVEIGQPINVGQIRNSNSYVIAGLARQYGAKPIMLGVASDAQDDIMSKLRSRREADLLVTTGGVSVGDFDVVKQVLQQEGQVDLWQVRIRPGKPLAFGKIGATPLLGLPGNPVAAAVAFSQFGRPAIRKMLGLTAKLPLMKARMLQRFENRGGRRHYVRGLVEWCGVEYRVCPVGAQGSGSLSGLAAANCYIVIPEQTAVIDEGALVDIDLFEHVFPI